MSFVSNSVWPPQTAAHQAPIPGILQARILAWAAISFSSAWKWKVKVKSLSHVRLFATPWTVAYQAPPSMEFSRQEYWSGVPLPSPSLRLEIYKSAWNILLCIRDRSLQLCLTLWDPMNCSRSGPFCPRDSSGKNTGVGCSALLPTALPPGDPPGLGIELISLTSNLHWQVSSLAPPGKPIFYFTRSVSQFRLQHAKLPCPSPTPGDCSKSCPFSWWCHPTISSSVVPFSSCLLSLPASGSFPMSQFFTSGGQSIGASAAASVLPINIQDWSPLGWTA